MKAPRKKATKAVKRTPFRLTATMVRRLGACGEQVELFRRRFPGGLPITLVGARKARDAGLSLRWAKVYLVASDDRYQLSEAFDYDFDPYKESHLKLLVKFIRKRFIKK